MLLSQALPGHTKGLVHARQAGQLHPGQRAQHEHNQFRLNGGEDRDHALQQPRQLAPSCCWHVLRVSQSQSVEPILSLTGLVAFCFCVAGEHSVTLSLTDSTRRLV